MKTRYGIIGFLLAVVLFGVWYCQRQPEEKRFVVSIADFAQLALLQKDSCVSRAQMMMLRRAEGELTKTVSQSSSPSIKAMTVTTHCCPCPSGAWSQYESCLCDAYGNVVGGYSMEYAMQTRWLPTDAGNQALLIVSQTDSSATQEFTRTYSDSVLQVYRMPELKAGDYYFRIYAAFDGGKGVPYNIKFTTDGKGGMGWNSK